MAPEHAGDRRHVVVEDPANLLEEVDEGEHRPGAGGVNATAAQPTRDADRPVLMARPPRDALTAGSLSRIMTEDSLIQRWTDEMIDQETI